MASELPVSQNAERPVTILVVEDDVVIRANIAELLREQSLTVVEAANADEAWEFLVAGGRPDLIFSDVHMPGSMDGLELARRVQEDYPSVKIAITSGNFRPRKKPEKVLFFVKPYALGQVVNALLEYLRSE